MNFSFRQFTFKRHIFSFILSFLITIVIAGILGLIFSAFSPPLWLINVFNAGIFYFSAALAGFFCTLGSEKNGFITGALCADIYGLILMLTGMMFFKTVFEFSIFLKVMGITTILGAITGVIGINFKKQ